MARNTDEGTRSLEVQKAQAEERRQRLEEEKHQLEIQKYVMEARKHQLEINKVGVDVLKHLTTVLAALLAILGYFGPELVPRLQGRHTFFSGLSDWEISILGLALSVYFSLLAMGITASEADVRNKTTEWAIYFILLTSGVSMLILLISLAI